MSRRNLIEINSLEEAALEPYRDIRHRNWTKLSGRFIAEGPLLVQRLVASGHPIESILLDQKYVEQYVEQFPANIPLLIVPHELVEQIVGFHFHRGVLACGRRPSLKRLSHDHAPMARNETWVGMVGVQDPENVGSILRCASGLGVQRVLIGPGTADPLSRRSLRVSMGNALGLELYESLNLSRDLSLLKQLGVECIATSLTDDSQPLESAGRSGPIILILGNERHGLPQPILRQADRRVRIDMAQSTDSLNVAVAAAIAMYHFCRIACDHER